MEDLTTVLLKFNGMDTPVAVSIPISVLPSLELVSEANSTESGQTIYRKLPVINLNNKDARQLLTRTLVV